MSVAEQIAATVAELAELDSDTRLERIYAVIRDVATENGEVQARWRNALVIERRWMERGTWRTALRDARQQRREADRQAPAEAPDDDRIRVHLSGDEPGAIRAISRAVEDGALPDVYVTSGQLVHLSRVSGDPEAAPLDGPPPPLPVRAETITAPKLANLLAHHTFTFRTHVTSDGDEVDAEELPTPRALASVLSARYWARVRPLHGIVGSPVLRPDGSLLQDPGYDQATGLYHAPKVAVPRIPDRPTREDVEQAKRFVLGRLLRDFPFVAQADRANHIGLLVTQILRPYLRCLTPLGLISATTQSSGKTLLGEIIGNLFGYKQLVWRKGDDAELEKTVTAALRGPAAVMLWDNLAEGSQVDSAILAALLTAPTWSGRVLGTSATVEIPNDRLWLVTGNNLRLGGDMATRTVLVRLDPNDPRPEERDQGRFGIPHLDQWIKEPANRVTVLRHLLVLVVDWVNAGAPRSGQPMRQFTHWAQAVGGLLGHHGIAGFLANVDDVREADEEHAEWARFLARWHEMWQGQRMQAGQVRASADPDMSSGTPIDRWHGSFMTSADGKVPSAKSLGRMLTGHVGRWHGRYVLRAGADRASNVRWYQVERKDPDA